MLLIESSRAAGRALLSGVANYARHHGRWVFFWTAAGLEKAWRGKLSLDVDGVILRDMELVEDVLAKGIPAVIVGHSREEIAGAANVVTDSEAIGRIAAKHLLSCGFRHFAFCGFTDCSWSKTRQVYFTKYIREAGFETRSLTVRSEATGSPWRVERSSIAKWLLTLPRPAGLMACNDDLGQEVLEACKLAGLKVPDDIAVIGADNDEIVCGLADPPMSSVAINFERAGYEAAQALDALMHGGKRGSRRILVRASHVEPRRSTDIVALDNPHLRRALTFIRDHGTSPISVPEVTRSAGVSRRTLETLFRAVVGNSVLSEIRRVRTAAIARLLVETEMPVAEIASSLGFEDAQHIARYFRQTQALSPLAFRKEYGHKHSGLRAQ
jgi:LacI family transcriptional regulator, galactose operon repressor